MRRILICLLLLVSACALPVPASLPLPQPQVDLPAGTPAPSVTPSPNFSVLYHPDGPLYVGDQVSMEVLSPSGFKSNDQKMRVSFDGKALGETDFTPYGIGARSEATFYWLWDTRGLQAGVQHLTFAVEPSGPTWSEDVTLLPAGEVPAPEPQARWQVVDTTCCTIHYVSGTAAARDLASLEQMADTQAADVQRRLQTKLKGKIELTFLPRVLGQGGFTSNQIYVSYVDQNYAGSTIAQVVHHEMVHWLDAQMGGDARVAFIQEGLAVYMSDGHFKVEPIVPRAAGLLQLNWYIPLGQLMDSFYTSQHEIGYMEAAALTSYMIQTYGWQRYNAMYRDLKPQRGGPSAVLNAGLEAHFQISLAQLETAFLVFLRKQTVTPDDLMDVRDTVAYYDTVRRYQQMLDPSAYFLTAWLPDGGDMQRRGIVADYLRHPTAAVNQQIEKLLVSADASLRAADYNTTALDIRAANLALDVIAKTQK